MKNIFKNLIICLITVSILISTTVSCKKEENLKSNLEPQMVEGTVEKAWWQWVVTIVCAVAIKVTEGQYEKETKPDGTIIERCKGWGTCSMQGSTKSNGKGEIDLSSVKYYEQPDYIGDGVLGFDNKGNIVFAMDDSPNNLNAQERFFNGKFVSISRPLIIDNPEVLELFDVSEPIVIQGNYDVHSVTEEKSTIKYIIIK